MTIFYSRKKKDLTNKLGITNSKQRKKFLNIENRKNNLN